MNDVFVRILELTRPVDVVVEVVRGSRAERNLAYHPAHHPVDPVLHGREDATKVADDVRRVARDAVAEYGRGDAALDRPTPDGPTARRGGRASAGSPRAG